MWAALYERIYADLMNKEQRQQAEKQRTMDWVQSKAPQGMSCPICGHRNWTIADVVELRPYEGGNLTLGGVGTFPAAQVVCANCGNTLLINAVMSGIVVQSEYTGESAPGPKTDNE